ncbi:MAG: M12 family metallo-peptidase [Bacteroidota bacterium]
MFKNIPTPYLPSIIVKRLLATSSRCLCSALFLAAALLFGTQTYAQDFNIPVKLFGAAPGIPVNLAGLKKPATKFLADAPIRQQILRLQPASLMLEMMIDDRQISIQLEKANVFSDDAAINAIQADGTLQQLQPLSAVYYRGKVAGVRSFVALSFFGDEITGIIEIETGSFNIGHLKNQTESEEIHYLYNSDDVIDKKSFTCFTNDDLPGLKPITPAIANAPNTLSAVGYPVDMYIETDYQNYLNFNRSTTEVTKWVAGLMNITEAIYANENIKVQLKTLSIWTVTDPYVSSATTSAALDVFSTRMTAGFNGDLAHLLKYSAGEGGIAYLDVLCSTSNLKTGVSFIANSYLLNSDYNRSVKVVTHEIGHNLGSPHTHKCAFWSGGTGIDNCGPSAGYPEGTCTAPTPATHAGTIMSYCDQTGQPGVRFANGFGPQPGNLIRAEVTAATCLNNCSNLTLALTKTDATCAALGSVTVTPTGGVAPITYLWSNGATTAAVTNLAKGTYTVTASSATAGCRVIKAVEIYETLGACPSITSFTPKYAPTGSAVSISGNNFTGATAVNFGTAPASSFIVNSNNSITAVVGAGGSGNVVVTNSSGVGGFQGFNYCNATSRFTTPALLGTITADVNVAGNNFVSNCFTNQYYNGSSPGNSNARNGNDVFYKFTTGACVFKLDITVCPGASGQDSYLWLLDSTGAVIASNDDNAPAGCISVSGSSLLAQNVLPNTTYYLVVESYFSNTDISWNLSIKPNLCTPPIITSFAPLTAAPGDSITITGNYFTDALSMRFNGTNATSFNVKSATQIGARIPVDVSMGRLSVSTIIGTAYSSTNFAPNTSASGVVKICPEGSIQLTSSLTGSIYKWQVLKPFGLEGFKDIVNGTTYANKDSLNLKINNAATQLYGYQYRCMVNNVASNIIQLRFSNKWTGAVNTAWENTGNWGCASKIPDVVTDVVIDRGTAVINEDAYARTIQVASTASLTLKQNKKLGLGYIYAKTPVNFLQGGSKTDYPNAIKQTADGGFVIAGYSNSALYGPGTNSFKEDFYISKMDGAGTVQWKQLIGGLNNERAYSIETTKDGGFIVAGSTQYYSPNYYNGYVSGNHRGQDDYWVVKLDKDGNIEWSKLLGGEGSDVAKSVQQTLDGGYILAGQSTSSASFDVTGINHGSDDYWVVKLDNAGNILWNKLLGGAGVDKAVAVVENAIGELVVSGTSRSSASGDVTGVNHGGSGDYWVVKLSATGTIIWNKLLGGASLEEAESMCLSGDGGYIITGLSSSSVNGDVTATTKGSVDYWTIKLNDAGGTVWNKLYGGSEAERAKSIKQTGDGGFIISGFSGSSASGNVTGTLSGTFTYDAWVIKLDAAGSLIWNKLMGGTNYDESYGVCQTTDGNIVVAAQTSSTNSGTLTGLTNNGESDIWIIKLDKLGNIIQ